MSLTPKQEAFCLAYMETGNASEAYRQAYDAENMKQATIKKRASELLANGAIAGTVDRLRAKAERRTMITVDSLVAELEEARQAALSAQTIQSSAAVAATMGKAKLLGLAVDKAEHDVSLSGGFILEVAGIASPKG